MLPQSPPADDAAGQEDKGVAEFGPAFPADAEAFEPVEYGEGLLDYETEFAQALDVR